MSIPRALRMPADFIDGVGTPSRTSNHTRRGYVLRGAAIAFAVAIVARFWMRAITEQPHKFSIGGTGFIFVVVSGLGAYAGLAFAWRRLGSNRRMLVQRGVGMAPFLLMGPFMVFFIPGLLAAVGLAHRRWRRWLRRSLLTFACLLGAFFVFALGSSGDARGVAKALLYLPVAYALFLTNRIVFEPRLRAPAAAQPPSAPDAYEPWLGWAYG